MATQQLEDEVKDSDLLAVYCLNQNPTPPIKVNIKVNGFVISMEVDTDALTNLLNWDTFQKINISSQFILSPTKCKLQTYSRDVLSSKGVVKVGFPFKGKNIRSKFLIISEKYPNLLDKDVLGMYLNWFLKRYLNLIF